MADVSSTLRLWSTTASNNAPSGSTAIGSNLDDNLRELQKVVRQYLASQGSNMSSSGTVDLSTADGYYIHITGATTITSFGTEAAGISYLLEFDGALTLTHNATSLILPGGANITTVAGDLALFVSRGGGNWKCALYTEVTAGTIDSTPLVRGSSDATKKIRFEVDGLTTATTRVLTAPDKDITVAGIVDFTGANGASLVLLATGTASASATLDFTSVVTDTYDSYMMTLENIAPAADAVNLLFRGSTNNGSSFLSGTEYNHSRMIIDTSAPTVVVGAGAANTSEIALAFDIGNAANESLSGTLFFHRKAAGRFMCDFSLTWVTSFPNIAQDKGGGFIAANAVNAVRLLMSSGNIASGTARLYGMRIS